MTIFTSDWTYVNDDDDDDGGDDDDDDGGDDDDDDDDKNIKLFGWLELIILL